MSLPSQGENLKDLKGYAFIYGMIYLFSFSIIKVVQKMRNKEDGLVYEIGPFYVKDCEE